MMKITGLSHLFKWENLHNWWLTKYFFAPLYIYIQRCKEYLKPYLSKSTDTLQWKWLHKLQVTNFKTTWVKVLVYLILTVLKYFNYTKYRLKSTRHASQKLTLWRSWGNRKRKGSVCRYFMEKLEQTIRQKKGTKNRMKGKQTTITFNNSQRTKETLGMNIKYIGG